MKRSGVPVVQCEYANTEKPLAHLLEESFRLYLARILAADTQRAVSYGR